MTVPLIELAHGRSGDKGNLSNIAILARKPEYLAPIAAQLTPEAVKDYMAHVVEGTVERYDWPGLNGFNFILNQSLGGGGVGSFKRYDPQGKAHAQDVDGLPHDGPGQLGHRGHARWIRRGESGVADSLNSSSTDPARARRSGLRSSSTSETRSTKSSII